MQKRINAIMFLISLCLLTNSISVYANKSLLNSKELTISDGLSNNTVRSIIKDDKGILWIGTENGLNRYDAYTFKQFNNKNNKSSTISDSFIRVLFKDRSGNIWIGTDNGGLIYYDWKSENTTTYKFNPNDENSISENSITAICESKDGSIWIGTISAGLNHFNRKTNKFTRYKHNRSIKNSLSNNYVQTLAEDEEGNLWIGTKGGGLNWYSPKTNVFKVFYSYPDKPNSLSSININDIIIDKDSLIWIATDYGLNSLSLKSNNFTRYYPLLNDINKTIGNKINKLYLNHAGYLWLGTDDGVVKYDIKNNLFNRISISSSKMILTLFEDFSGILWCGTVNNGILKYTNAKKNFNVNLPENIIKDELYGKTIRSIFVENDKSIWIGTDGDGLKYFDSNSGKVYNIPSEPYMKNHVNGKVISAISKDSQGNLWVGSWGEGITKIYKAETLNPKIKKVTYYKKNRHHPNSLADNIVQCIFEDSKCNIWVGTDDGLDLYNPDTDNFIHIKHRDGDSTSLIDNRIQSNSIIEDNLGNLWIGTWAGISKMCYNPKVEVENIYFSNYSSSSHGLSDDRITGLILNDNILWASTAGGGLNKLETRQQQNRPNVFKYYKEEDGLPNNLIYSIIVDNNNQFWMTTNHGLSKFYPETEIFKNYYESDGLLSNQFYWSAIFKDCEGTIYVGSIKGLNSFHPDEIIDNRYIPPIIITDILLSNRSIRSIPEYQDLIYKFNTGDVLELPFYNYSYTFEFVALDFSNPEKNQYSYFMEGVDEEWIDAGNRRFVTYSNLKEGNYVFRVRGSNDDGLWNNEGSSLELIIHPPFWKTWWFIFLISAILLGNIGYIIFLKISRYLEVENIRNQIATDLHDNIGAGLTEISFISEVLSRKSEIKNKHDIQEYLQRIGNNSRELLDSMGNIIWLINPKNDTLYKLIFHLGDCYRDLLLQAGISFKIKNIDSIEKLVIKPDIRQHLFLIFKEGLNNCIKHSNCKSIVLQTNVKGRFLTIQLVDDGKGFDLLSIKSGNGIQNMIERGRKINGELKIYSENEKGTKILFRGIV